MNETKRILIVEDDQMIIDAYTKILKSEGYEVYNAGDGEEALELATRLKIDLIMLDIMMPVMDGIEFLRKFQPKQHPETKVVILSNSSSLEKLKEAITLGAAEYLIKTDVKPSDVKVVVKGLLATASLNKKENENERQS